MAPRPPVGRLLVSPSLVGEVDAKRIEVILATRKELTKTAIHDAIVRVGLRHIDEVAALLNPDLGSPEAGLVGQEASRPEKPAVVAGIVTSSLGVLVGRRHDNTPPWTFIAGEIEPGESPADAVMREVKEETGLRVMTADREIGRRVHPKTGRTMIYLACSPTGKTDVFVGDTDELAEVRWVSLTEAEELLSGMFEPVHQYLTEHLTEEPTATDDTPGDA